MSKTWFCSGWFGLYLTPAPRMSCWCRGLLLVVLICLPFSSLQACESWFGSVVIWGRLNSSGCSSCSWCSYSLEMLPMEWLGFTVEEVYIWLASSPPGRQLGLVQLVTHCWCVCVLWCMHTPCLGVEHAHMYCELPVCVCSLVWCTRTWRWISSADPCAYPLQFNFFANLPSGYATWHNTWFSFFVFVCRDHQLSKMDMEFIIYKIKWRWSCRI
jgi:hypothetical protein